MSADRGGGGPAFLLLLQRRDIFPIFLISVVNIARAKNHEDNSVPAASLRCASISGEMRFKPHASAKIVDAKRSLESPVQLFFQVERESLRIRHAHRESKGVAQ